MVCRGRWGRLSDFGFIHGAGLDLVVCFSSNQACTSFFALLLLLAFVCRHFTAGPAGMRGRSARLWCVSSIP